MNEEQVKSLVRWALTTLGGLVAGYFAAKGWFSVDQINSVLNSEVVIGLITSAAMAIWGYFVHTTSNAVAVANAIPAVAGVITAPTADGRALAASVPSVTVAPAGTTAAAAVAKAM